MMSQIYYIAHRGDRYRTGTVRHRSKKVSPDNTIGERRYEIQILDGAGQAVAVVRFGEEIPTPSDDRIPGSRTH